MAMEVTEILLNAQSADGSVRKHAEESLKQFQEQNLPGFLSSLSAELANELKPIDSRKLSGLILKDALDAKEKHRKSELVQRWLSLDVSIKTQIKSFLLQTLSSRVHEARSTASQVIAKVAGIELPKKQWPELITSLLPNINQVPTHVKQATLETVGYIFEEVTYLVEQDQANKNLTTLVEHFNASKASNDAKLVATRALYKARAGTAARENFFSSLEEGYIMKVVCEEILSPEVKIRQAAYEYLVAISSSYHEKLSPFIQETSSNTAKFVKEAEEAVALQTIEILNWICGVEIGIIEKYGFGEFAGAFHIPCIYFIKKALPALVPVLLETLLKHEDEGAWNLSMACRQCLRLVARTVGDDIVPLVAPFIETNITKPDWGKREGAICALGSILEGPSPNKLTPLVNVALAFMPAALVRDPHNLVKVTTAWTLGRIFWFVLLNRSTMESPIVTPDDALLIMDALLLSLEDAPNVAEKAYGALYLVVTWWRVSGQPSILLTAIHRKMISSESTLRTAAYETLNEVVSCSNAPMVLQLVPVITMELHKALEDHNLLEVPILCGFLQMIIQKIGSSDATKYVLMQYTDQIMSLLVRYAPQIVQFLKLMYMEKDTIKMLESFSIQSEIMKRLPVESLIRFRSVSKAWKNLIESSQFIMAHSHHRHSHPHHLLVSDAMSYDDAVCLKSFRDDDTFPRQPSVVTAPLSIRRLICVSVVGSSHGVFCVCGYVDRQGVAVVWNPSIRKSVAVPVPESYFWCLGFGVCPVTGDPKLLSVDCGWEFAKVFTLSSGEWRSIPMPLKVFSRQKVTTRNFIYWRSTPEKIASFDLTSETFEATDLPLDLIYWCTDDSFHMSKIRESLALIVSKGPALGTGTIFAVWALEDDGVQRSFTKLYNITTPSKFDIIYGSRKSGMLIMRQTDPAYDHDDIGNEDDDPPRLVVYDPNSGHTDVLEVDGLTYGVNAQTYEETLLLLSLPQQ